VTVARPVRPGAYLVGVTAALSLPLWLGSSRLARLVRAPAAGALRSRRGHPADALKAAHRALRLLAGTRLPWWRNTCLYRALAECLVLRRYGIACRVELGVTRSGEAIGAHAWVVRGNGGPEPATGSTAVLR
jgi:hypothetical protein